jgi:hypothetical protein
MITFTSYKFNDTIYPRALRVAGVGFGAWMWVCLSACNGEIGDAAGDPGATQGSGPNGVNGSAGSSMANGGSSVFACSQQTVEPGPSPMRLLSRDQYLNTVRDLFGDIAQLDTVLDNRSASAFGLVQADVAQVDLEAFETAANMVAAASVANKLNVIAPCSAGADQRGCARAFLQTFGSRIYRAPLSEAADVDRHLGLYDLGISTSYAHGIEMMLRGMLQAPRFLYRVEFGTTEQVGADAVKLSGFEVASRLSYALWNTMPDDKLTAAAAAGGLSTKEGVAAQLTWMLADPRGSTMVRRFLEDWVHLADLNNVVKDATKFPEWTGTTLRDSMRTQAQSFFDYILHSQSGQLSSLLTSSTVFVNKDVGGYYGVTGGSTFQSLERTDGTVSGLLTLPAVLATLAKPAESSPIYRGKFVREQLLCQQLPPPPPNVPKPPDTQPGVSPRERFAQHETDPLCKGCHTLMDPIGFGFENYDAVGRYRTTENGLPVDASGEVVQTDDMNGKFVGVAELGTKLAGSHQVQACVARQWFRFVLNRFEQDVDNCSMKHLVDKFGASNNDLNSLPFALAETDAFLYRRPISSVSP